jgi:hypothetical protein
LSVTHWFSEDKVSMASKGVMARTRSEACLEWRGDVVADHQISQCGGNGGQKAQLLSPFEEE